MCFFLFHFSFFTLSYLFPLLQGYRPRALNKHAHHQRDKNAPCLTSFWGSENYHDTCDA
jgi:hypothetical protein